MTKIIKLIINILHDTIIYCHRGQRVSFHSVNIIESANTALSLLHLLFARLTTVIMTRTSAIQPLHTSGGTYGNNVRYWDNAENMTFTAGANWKLLYLVAIIYVRNALQKYQSQIYLHISKVVETISVPPKLSFLPFSFPYNRDPIRLVKFVQSQTTMSYIFSNIILNNLGMARKLFFKLSKNVVKFHEFMEVDTLLT